MIPFIAWEAGVSPGCTLAVKSITGLFSLNLKARFSFFLLGNKLSLKYGSLSLSLPSWEVMVTKSMFLSSGDLIKVSRWK